MAGLAYVLCATKELIGQASKYENKLHNTYGVELSLKHLRMKKFNSYNRIKKGSNIYEKHILVSSIFEMHLFRSMIIHLNL